MKERGWTRLHDLIDIAVGRTKGEEPWGALKGRNYGVNSGGGTIGWTQEEEPWGALRGGAMGCTQGRNHGVHSGVEPWGELREEPGVYAYIRLFTRKDK